MLSLAELDLIDAISAAAYGRRPLKAVSPRSNNAVYRIEFGDCSKVAKFGRDATGASIRKELMLFDLLRAHGIPVPVVELADPDGRIAGRPFMLMAQAGVHTLHDLLSAGPMHPVERLYEEMGGWLARVHAISFPGPGTIEADRVVPFDLPGFVAGLRGWAGQLASEGWLTAAEAGAIQALPAPEIEGTALCHGDFHAPQCVVDRGRIAAIVDWESARSADPAVDHEIALTYLEFYSSPALVAAFRRGYAERRAEPAPRGAPLRALLLLNLLRVWKGLGPAAWRAAIESGRVAKAVDQLRRGAASRPA